MKWKWSLAGIAGLFTALILTQFLYDPLSLVRRSLNAAEIRDQFSDARAKWDAAALTDYSFELHGASQNICAVDAVIEVRNNRVVEVMPSNMSTLLPAGAWADPDWGNEVFLCDYNHFTIPRMFVMVEKTLQNSPSAILEAEFDPLYGFITHFKDGLSARSGWLNPITQSVYNEFQIINFQPQ